MSRIIVATSPVSGRKIDPPPVPFWGPAAEVFSAAAKSGADGVELRLHSKDEGDWANLRKEAAENGLVISGVSSGRMAREGRFLLNDPDQTKREEAIVGMEKIADFCAILGADLLVGSAKGNQSEDESISDYSARIGESFQAINEYSKKLGIRVHIEAINRYEINCITSGHETLEFIDQYDLDNCFVHLDTFHMNIEEDDVSKTIKECAEKLGYIQFADSNRQYVGAGHINFDRVFEALADINYQSDLGIECQPIPSGEIAAKKSVDALRALSQKYGLTSHLSKLQSTPS